MNFNALRATAFGLSLTLLPAAGGLFAQELVPILPRVNVQADSARLEQVVDGEWVAVGTRKAHAIQHDYTRPYDGKPSYRFELKADEGSRRALLLLCHGGRLGRPDGGRLRCGAPHEDRLPSG